MSIQRITISALLWVALVSTGCNSDRLPTYPTAGKVAFEDGQPVQSGSIEFYNAEYDVTARGNIGRDGTYQLSTFHANDGAIAGEHEVVVMQLLMPAPVMKPEAGVTDHHHGRHVDKKFANYGSSSLRCTIEKGDNVCDFTVSGSRR